MGDTNIVYADWVTTKMGYGCVGLVRRVARDGSWADVRWHEGGKEWTKRMQTKHLVVLHTIPFCCGMTVTDMKREKELNSQK